MTSFESLNEIDKRFRGLTGPVRRGEQGFFRIRNTLDIIRASLQTLFTTRPGERVMLPEYGSRIQEILFQPNDVVTRSLAVEIINESVVRWEPRILVSSVEISSGEIEGQEERLYITIYYVLKVTNTEDSVTLVFRRQAQALSL